MFEFSKEFQSAVLLQKLRKENIYVRASMQDDNIELEGSGSPVGQCYLITRLLVNILMDTYKQTHDKKLCAAFLHSVVSVAAEIMGGQMHDS